MFLVILGALKIVMKRQPKNADLCKIEKRITRFVANRFTY